MKSRANTAPAARRSPAKPGAMLKSLRIQRGWTLKEVSQRTGYPVSTLSKIENDRVSLTFDKLTRISAGLEVDFSRLFGAQEEAPTASGLQGRRSVVRAGEGKSIESKNYSHLYPAAELLNKRIIPIIVELHARSLEEFGELLQHSGEEYTYVLEGEVDVHTNVYAPVRLRAGDSIYFDSGMPHGYVAASDKPCRVLAICTGGELQMIAAVGGRPAGGASADSTAPASPAHKRPRQRRSR
jgi:transcriptional regulator with XRE-family HTH domain